MAEKVMRAVGTLIECDDRILFLKRSENSTSPGCWGLPAGGIEDGESDIEASVRETWEETGFKVSSHQLEYVTTIHLPLPDKILMFATYRTKVDSAFNAVLNPKEHSDYCWMTPRECCERSNLIHGLRELLEEFYLTK